MDTPVPGPGWYPVTRDHEGWWDGHQWTHRTRPSTLRAARVSPDGHRLRDTVRIVAVATWRLGWGRGAMAWWWRAPFWFRWLLFVAAYAPLMLLVLPHAFQAHPRHPFSGMGGGASVIGVIIVDRIRHPEVWALSAQRRRLLRLTVSTGQSSGDPDVDPVALDLLHEQARYAVLCAIVVVAMVVGVGAVGIAAAMRTGRWWWVAAAAPVPLFSVATLALNIVRPPRARMARLMQG